MRTATGVTELPPGFRTVATSPNAPIAIIADDARKFYATQFHLEVMQHAARRGAVAQFRAQGRGLRRRLDHPHLQGRGDREIRAQVGQSKVLAGFPARVDSAVAAALLHAAIGNQLTCVFVDHGLLRRGEAKRVMSLFRGSYNILLLHVQARERFLEGLAGVTDPEDKRKIIGKLFIDVFAEEAEKLGGEQFLAQGTLYPDVIKSVSPTGGPSLRSHHNVGGLPERCI